jgi:hypothetical protein
MILRTKHYRTLTELLDREPSIEDQEKLGLYFLKLRALVKGSAFFSKNAQ